MKVIITTPDGKQHEMEATEVAIHSTESLTTYFEDCWLRFWERVA